MDYDILPATKADAPAILALQRLAYLSEAMLYGDWDIPPLTQPLEALLAEFSRLSFLKAVPLEPDQEPGPGSLTLVGSVRAGLSQGVCHIGRLMVHPEHQGRGLGSALLAAMEARFPKAQRYSLFTGSRSEGNIRLYRRHGYEIVRTQAISDSLTLVHMEKPSASAP